MLISPVTVTWNSFHQSEQTFIDLEKITLPTGKKNTLSLNCCQVASRISAWNCLSLAIPATTDVITCSPWAEDLPPAWTEIENKMETAIRYWEVDKNDGLY